MVEVLMNSEEIAKWLQGQLSNTGAWFTPVSTTTNRSTFEVDMPDGVSSATIVVEIK
jgi:hypothetical protein